MSFCKKIQKEYLQIATELDEIKSRIENLEIDYIKKGKREYANIPASFDIEASSFYNDTDHKVALMYIWQFGIRDTKNRKDIIIIGRNWTEWKIMMSIIAEKVNEKLLVCYIHNLSYEFSFFRQELSGYYNGAFLSKENTPLYAQYGSIEFRCSYMLSGVGLDKLKTKTKKLKGDLDYAKVRHEATPLTDEEMAYCINDVVILLDYIESKIDNDGDITKIPLTKTGYVRKGLKTKCIGDEFISNKKRNYKELISGLKITEDREYLVLRKAYSGGFTGANPMVYDNLVANVMCWDFTSSYPSTVCESGFPTNLLFYKDKMTEEEYKVLIDRYRAIASKVTYYNLKAKEVYTTSISFYNTDGVEIEGDNVDFIFNNGKVAKADKAELFITNVDYEIIKENYDYDKAEFEYCYVYETGYLPRDVIEYILGLYKAKTTLKNVKGSEVYYNRSKEDLNSTYGCSVTDPCKSALIEDESSESGYSREELTPDTLYGLLKNYNRKLGSSIAMPYQWGIWISAFARRNLWMGIRQAGYLGLFLYSDTDSMYVVWDKNLYPKEVNALYGWIKDYNNWVAYKMEKMCKKFGFASDMWKPKTVEGIEKPLGYWDNLNDDKEEDFYTFFKTLGAKRYIKQTKDGQIKITVAGLGKKQGAKYITENFESPFDAFTEGMIIPKGETGKNTHTIITYESQGQVTDYLGNTVNYISNGGTHLEPCGFVMSVTADYIKYVLGCRESCEVGL